MLTQQGYVWFLVNDLRKEFSGVVVLSDERLDDFDDLLFFAARKGISNRMLAEALGIDGSSVTKRIDVVRVRGAETVELKLLRKRLMKKARMKKRRTNVNKLRPDPS